MRMRRPKSSRRPRPTRSAPARKACPSLELLEDRNLLSGGQWLAVFNGISPGYTLDEQTQFGRDLLHSAGLSDPDVRVVSALDLTGTFALQTPADVTQET